MFKRFIGSVVLGSALLVACSGGGGSGVSSSKTLVSLSDGEITDLCEYSADVVGPQQTIDCGGGQTVTIGDASVADCVADFQELQDENPSCAATVGNAEGCLEAIADSTDAQLCSSLPAACAALFACFL